MRAKGADSWGGPGGCCPGLGNLPSRCAPLAGRHTLLFTWLYPCARLSGLVGPGRTARTTGRVDLCHARLFDVLGTAEDMAVGPSESG